MATPEESGVLRQLIEQIDSEISTFRPEQDEFTTSQSSLGGSSDSFDSRVGAGDSQDALAQPATTRPLSTTSFPSGLEAPQATFTEQGKALFGDSSEWIQAELYRAGSLGGTGPRAPQQVPLDDDAHVPQRKPVDSGLGSNNKPHRISTKDEDKDHLDSVHDVPFEAPKLLELSFSTDDLTSLIDTANSIGTDAGQDEPWSVAQAQGQALDSGAPPTTMAASSPSGKYQPSFPPRHSSPLKKGFVAGEDDEPNATPALSEAASTPEKVEEGESMHLRHGTDSTPLVSESSSPTSLEGEDVEPAVVPRRHESTAFRDQVRAERKRLSLVTTGVGLSATAAASGTHASHNRISSIVDLPSWDLAPLSPPVFVKETNGTTSTTTAATTINTTIPDNTASSTTATAMRSPPPTRKLPPPPEQQQDYDTISTPISATATMTPTTPLSTREARILAGREVLLRSNPDSIRSVGRSGMTTSSTASSLATTMSDRHGDGTLSGDYSMGSGARGAMGGTTPRHRQGMTAMQYWKLVQEQELQSMKSSGGGGGGGGVMGAIPGRGRMIELYSQITQQEQVEAPHHEQNEGVEVHREGILKVRPERLVYPDQSIRPIPLKAFRVRKMTLAERNQAYAQACHEFSKARTGLDVWILRSMMQDRPELMKNPPTCALQAQKSYEAPTSGRRGSKDANHFYHNSNHSWNTSSSASLHSPMTASTPMSAGVGGMGGAGPGNGSNLGFGSVSSATTASSFVGGARAKIKSAGKRLSMELSQNFAASAPSPGPPVAEDGRRSSMSTHSQHSTKSSATSSTDRSKNGGAEGSFYKQKTKSAVELGSWSSERSRSFSGHQQQDQQQDSMVASGPSGSSFGSQRDSFHSHYQQHQRQQQQKQEPMYTSMQRASSLGTSNSSSTSINSITTSSASNRQRHSFSGPGANGSGTNGPGANGPPTSGPGALRSRTALGFYDPSTMGSHRHSMMDVGAGSARDGPGVAQSNFNSVSSRRRSVMGPGAESSERYSSSVSGLNNVRTGTASNMTGARATAGMGTGVDHHGDKHEISRSTSASSFSSTSSTTGTPTTAAASGTGAGASGSSSMGYPKSSAGQSMSSLSMRRRPISMMVSTNLTSLVEHQAMTTEAPIASSVAAGAKPLALPLSQDTSFTSGPAGGSGGSSIPMADETTSKEIYSPLTSPIIIPEGGFNILPGSALAIRAAAITNSPPTPREGGSAGGGLARPLTFAGYGPATMNISSLALGPSVPTAVTPGTGAAAKNANEPQGNGVSPKFSTSSFSKKKKKDGLDSLGFARSFRRDKSDKRASKLGIAGPSSPSSPASTVSTATGASMVAAATTGMAAHAGDLHGSSSVMTMNMTEALWEQSLDKLSDVLPHVDRDRLLIYLQRAGGDEMVAIGLVMSDMRNGDL